MKAHILSFETEEPLQKKQKGHRILADFKDRETQKFHELEVNKQKTWNKRRAIILGFPGSSTGRTHKTMFKQVR